MNRRSSDRTKTTIIAIQFILVLFLFLGVLHRPISAAAGNPPEPDSPAEESAVTYTISYQGRLDENGIPYDGTCDFEFEYWDALSGGSPVDPAPQYQLNVPVVDGLFSVQIGTWGPGIVFYGAQRWLEVAVRCPAGSGSYVLLSPRQELTPAPSAHTLVPGTYIEGDEIGPVLGVINQSGSALDLFSYAGNGLHLYAAGDGLNISYAGSDGINICYNGSASGCVYDGGNHGIEMGNIENDGIHISKAMDSGVYVNEAWMGMDVYSATQGINLSYIADTGLYIGSANRGVHVGGAQTGIMLDSIGGTGLSLGWSGGNGIYLGSTGNFGLVVEDAGTDGLRVNDAADDGVQVGSYSGGTAPNYGLYTATPGVANIALLVQTTNASDEWGLYTPDKISAANVTFSTLTLYAKVDGSSSLAPGDLAAVSGLAGPLPGTQSEIPLVRAADQDKWPGVIGVVHSRMVLQAPPGKEGEGILVPYSEEGPAQPGDYVAITVFGVGHVRADPDAAIAAGDRLTAAGFPGAVRPLRTESLNGMIVTEGAPVIGVALSGPDPETGLVSVLVSLR